MSVDGVVVWWYNVDLLYVKVFCVELFEGCGMVYEVFEYAVKRYASRSALGEWDVEEMMKMMMSDG